MEAAQTISVLHVSQPTTAGVPNVVLSLVRDQVRRGWNVGVACPPEGYLASEARLRGAQIHRWDATRNPSPAMLGELWSLRSIIRCTDPDLVHLHSAKAGLVGRLALRKRCPTVFQPHAWSFHAVTGLVARVTRAWERHGARWASAIVAVSDDERAEGTAAGVQGRYAVVPNGVDAHHYDVRPAASARQDLGLPEAPTVVCVGRLCDQKGQDRLLDMWHEVVREVPAARLVLVGEGAARPLLEAKANGRRSIELAGNQTDVRAWLSAASVVVLPSRWEAGLSLVAMEAMASGRSVVATDVAGARVIEQAGAGAVVGQADDRHLLRAIVERLRDPGLAELEGCAGRAAVERNFDAERTAISMASVYLNCLEKPDEQRSDR